MLTVQCAGLGLKVSGNICGFKMATTTSKILIEEVHPGHVHAGAFQRVSVE
jgi:hypothetical protein